MVSVVRFLLKSQGSCQTGTPLSTSPVRVRTSILNISRRTQAKMLSDPTTMQLAEMDKSHLVFLKTFALLELLSSPSHQFGSFNFYKIELVTTYNAILK